VVVEASGEGSPGMDPTVSPWALSVIQAVLPLAACAPVALALQSVL
jgi:hypothetical protein